MTGLAKLSLQDIYLSYEVLSPARDLEYYWSLISSLDNYYLEHFEKIRLEKERKLMLKAGGK